MALPYELLEWDSGFFGFGVAHMLPCTPDEQALRDTLQELKEKNCRLLYWFTEPSDTAANLLAMKYGGKLADEKVTFTSELNGGTTGSYPAGISEYEKGFAEEALIDLSVQSGEYSRFRLDGNFPPDSYKKLYEIWIQKCVSRELADSVLVYLSGEKISGMITLSLRNGTGNIILIGVDRQERGKNIGTSLIEASRIYFLQKNICRLNVVTQKANIPACRFYEKNGFEIDKIENIYHFWI